MPSSADSTCDGRTVAGCGEDSLLIGLCTLNEARNIETMISLLRKAIPEADLLVVDDESSDGTGEIVARLAESDPRVRLLVRRGERGLGGAFRAAVRSALEGDYQFFLNLDADLSHDPEQLPQLLDRMQRSPDIDVVVGSRYMTGGAIDGWPKHRRIMSRLVNGFARFVLRLPVSDCSGSMRCYRVAALRAIGLESVRSNGYAILEEVLVRLHRSGSKMAEVPIKFTDRVEGESKLTLAEAIRSSLRMVTLALR